MGETYLDVVNQQYSLGHDLMVKHGLSDVLKTHGYYKAIDPEQRAFDFVSICDAVSALVRIHGVPDDTTVTFRKIADGVLGAAVFKDVKRCQGGQILLSPEIYDQCDPKSILDVYFGVGLHESGHIEFTRLLYKEHIDFKTPYGCIVGLFEDERIEQLVSNKSPGFTGYIHATKLFVEKKLESKWANWDSFSYEDKAWALIFCYLRMPHLLTAKMREFVLPKTGANAYNELNKICDYFPYKERECLELGKKVRDLFFESSPEPKHDEESEESEESKGKGDSKSKDSKKSDPKNPKSDMEFGIETILDLMGESGGVTKIESEKIKELTDDKITRETEFSSNVGETRKVALVTSKPCVNVKRAEIYSYTRKPVLADVRALKNLFTFRQDSRKYVDRELLEGKLDRSRLGLGVVSDRVFQQTTVRTKRGISIALLLDESGSMISNIKVVRQVAILLVEAMLASKSVNLSVFSHTSTNSDRDCFVKHLYSKENPHIEAIGAYGERIAENYDHVAIDYVGKFLVQSEPNYRKVLIVLSDGAPLGHSYGGDAAIRATQQVVKSLRQKKIEVLQVAVGEYAGSNAIYGVKNVIQLKDMKSLVQDLKKYFVKVVRLT